MQHKRRAKERATITRESSKFRHPFLFLDAMREARSTCIAAASHPHRAQCDFQRGISASC